MNKIKVNVNETTPDKMLRKYQKIKKKEKRNINVTQTVCWVYLGNSFKFVLAHTGRNKKKLENHLREFSYVTPLDWV